MSLVVTTPVLLLSVGLDGFAIKSVADRWAAAAGADRERSSGRRPRCAASMWPSSTMLGQFGVTAVLLGVACWTSELYDRTIALIAIAAGVLGVLCGTVQALSGRLTTFSYLVLLTASLGLFTLWLALASVVLYREAPRLDRSRP